MEEKNREIKELKQTIQVMKGVIKQQDERLSFFERIFTDWIEDQKEALKLVSPNYE